MDNELYHYGVKGMRWGVRRAEKLLSGTSEQRNKGISSLNKHLEKGSAKVAKLENKHKPLQKKVDKNTQKTDVKAAKMKSKSAKLRKKSYGMFVSKSKHDKLIYKADKLDINSDVLITKSNKAKAKLLKNEKMTELFKIEINKINKILADQGSQFIKNLK